MNLRWIIASKEAKNVEEGIPQPTNEEKVDGERICRCKWIHVLLKLLVITNLIFFFVSVCYVSWCMIENFQSEHEEINDMSELPDMQEEFLYATDKPDLFIMEPELIEMEPNLILDDEEMKNNIIKALLNLENDSKDNFPVRIHSLLETISPAFQVFKTPQASEINTSENLEVSELLDSSKNSNRILNWLPSGEGISLLFDEDLYIPNKGPSLNTPAGKAVSHHVAGQTNPRMRRTTQTDEDESQCNLKFSLNVNTMSIDELKRHDLKQINVSVEPIREYESLSSGEEKYTGEMPVKNRACGFHVLYKHVK